MTTKPIEIDCAIFAKECADGYQLYEDSTYKYLRFTDSVSETCGYFFPFASCDGERWKACVGAKRYGDKLDLPQLSKVLTKLYDYTKRGCQ